MSRVVPARLPADLAKSVDRLVKSGKYRNRSEVIKEATRMLVSSGDLPQSLAIARVASRVASLIVAWNTPGVESIVLYGSAARGIVTSESDVDLLVVVERGEPWKVRRRLYELIYPVIASMGIDISIMVVTDAGWREMIRQNDPITTSILKEGETLWGHLARQA